MFCPRNGDESGSTEDRITKRLAALLSVDSAELFVLQSDATPVSELSMVPCF